MRDTEGKISNREKNVFINSAIYIGYQHSMNRRVNAQTIEIADDLQYK